jgi:hypothetical protein
LLLSRLRYLINDVNLSLGLKDINCFRNSYEAVTFDMNETLELKQNISEFLGILYYLESQHNEMLASFGDKLEKLKLRLLSHSL